MTGASGAQDRAPTPPAPPAPPSAWRRLARVLRPRLRRVDVSVAALLALLGFAAAVQVRSAQDDGLLAAAREEDLVRILDDLSNREDRLRRELASLTAAKDRLSSGSDQAQVALEQAQRRTLVLGVLTGTVEARGPGIVLTLTDPQGELGADVLLDALEELRGAGAEAIQVEGPVVSGEGEGTAPVVRVVASTALVDAIPDGASDGNDGPRGVEVDGTLLRPPYRFTVLGDPGTLASAMAIPGGVEDVAERAGGQVVVTRGEALAVTALRQLSRPRYARPTGESD
ncbi:MAG: DUF881 domain-containing protein [Mycobacteriales bacterium]|nr:DUF881 domain-containing protein [Mycobacteriales bacterium]